MNSSRTIIIIGFIVAFFTVLLYRLFDIQILKSDNLKFFARRQQIVVEKVLADRGFIYDRNNLLLVYNRNDVSFFVDLRMLTKKDKIKIANKFSSVFGGSKKYFLSEMSDSGKTICIEKKAPSEKALLVKNFKINGLFYREDPTTVYFYKNLASHLLGYVGNDYKGVDGIEKSCDDLLSGQDGSMVVLRDAIGDMITVAEEETKTAVPGVNIYLTIDKTYQSILEQELQDGLEKFGGTSAVGIIMNPNDGQILALANSADYDPNEYWKYTDTVRRDRAVTDTYEPGSTFKSFTMAALLDKNLCNLDENIYVENGRYKFKNVYITDAHKSEWLTARGVIEESSNIGMSKLVQRLDDDTFYKYLRAFGFGNYTSIELPGEVRGLLRKPNDWGQVTKEFMSFGYGVTVTPVQLISAYCAIVNGGILYQPQIIEKEVKRDGQVIYESSPKEIRRVISEETSFKMRNLLVGVVKEGTGTNAQLKSVTVGGKTGTSQKLIDGKYSKQQYNSSFVGFFPANNPQLVCLILVNSPTVGRYGGSVAAPIFKNVAEKIIELNPGRFQDYQNIPSQKNILITENVKETKTQNQNSSSISDSTKYIMSLSNIKNMPDLKDYSLRDAIQILSKLGLKYKVYGSGKVVSQSIQPGEHIRSGLSCELNCKEPIVDGTVVY
ncbi:MAG: transpeptidase family protein [Bacteroidetes bacterium]|nr:transpeptidase family protein [Bacteroidota bacterium]